MQIRKTESALAAAPRQRAEPVEFLVTVSSPAQRLYEVRAARCAADALIDALERHGHARGLAIRALAGARP